MNKLKLYVGCALTEAPPEFREEVRQLKEKLKEDYDVLEFLGLTAGTPRDVFDKDIRENVGTCDFMLAVCDHPSIGVGIELAFAAALHQKPVLVVTRKGKRLTRIIPGMASFYPQIKIEIYEDMIRDVPNLLAKTLDAHEHEHEEGVSRWERPSRVGG